MGIGQQMFRHVWWSNSFCFLNVYIVFTMFFFFFFHNDSFYSMDLGFSQMSKFDIQICWLINNLSSFLLSQSLSSDTYLVCVRACTANMIFCGHMNCDCLQNIQYQSSIICRLGLYHSIFQNIVILFSLNADCSQLTY